MTHIFYTAITVQNEKQSPEIEQSLAKNWWASESNLNWVGEDKQVTWVFSRIHLYDVMPIFCVANCITCILLQCIPVLVSESEVYTNSNWCVDFSLEYTNLEMSLGMLMTQVSNI